MANSPMKMEEVYISKLPSQSKYIDKAVQDELKKMEGEYLKYTVHENTLKLMSDDFFNAPPLVKYLNKSASPHPHITQEPAIVELILEEPKKKKPTKLETAISELEGMGFSKPLINESKLYGSYQCEVRVQTSSPIFGKIIKIELANGNDIHGEAQEKAIIWIWKEAKRRLLEGKVL